jgi:hypothetical protein
MTAPDRAFLPQMPHGVAQVNSDASENARLVYQPQRAQTAILGKPMPKSNETRDSLSLYI